MVSHTHTHAPHRKILGLAGSTATWLLLFAASVFSLRWEVIPEGPLRWLVATVPTIAAVFVLLAHIRWIRSCDELQRRIQLEGLAVGFGGALLIVSGYGLFEILGAPEMGIAAFMVVLAVCYLLGTYLGWRRYR